MDKYVYTKPAEVKEARELKLNVFVYEGAKTPGELHGVARLVDDQAATVHEIEIPAEYLLPFAQLKQELLAALGAVFVPASAEAEAPK